MHFLIAFVVLVLVTDRNAEARQHCLSCNEVPTPHSCTRVTQCGDHESCFTESIVSTSGIVLYNVGCMSKLKCSASNVGKRDVIVTCIECCSTDFCNVEGCGIKAVPRENRGPYCYHCEVQQRQNSCQDVDICDQDQVCILEPSLPHLPDIYYKSRCGEKSMCLEAQQKHENTQLTHNLTGVIVGRRYGAFGDCPACCDTDFCNDNCSENNSVAIIGTAAPERTTSFDITNESIMTLTSAKPRSTTTHYVSTHPVTHVHQEQTSTHMPTTRRVVENCSQHGSGYIQMIHLCIKFHFDLMDFNRSSMTCAKEGAMLVTIDTEDKMSEIWTVLHNISGHLPDFWIGGRDVNKTDTFYWQIGSKVYNYSNWGKIPQQPEDPRYHDQDCIILHRLDNYTWYDEPCYRHYGFICEQPMHAIHSRTQQTTPCGSHDEFLQLDQNLGCVRYIPTPMDWNTASNYCRRLDSHLVHIESEEKQRAIYRFMQAHNEISDFWNGLVSATPKPRNTNDWRWDSRVPYSYMNWGTIQPHGAGNCVIMIKDGSWYDRDCSTHHKFICEKY